MHIALYISLSLVIKQFDPKPMAQITKESMLEPVQYSRNRQITLGQVLNCIKKEAKVEAKLEAKKKRTIGLRKKRQFLMRPIKGINTVFTIIEPLGMLHLAY